MDFGLLGSCHVTLATAGEGRASRVHSPRDISLVILVPALAFMVIFFIYPLCDILWKSISLPRLGMQNYVWFFTNNVNVAVSLRTFWTALIVSAVCLVLAYPYAYVMSRVRPRMRALLLAIVLTPLWTSLMVRTLAWIVLLQDTGVINDVLEMLGIGRLQLIRTTTGVIIGMAQMLMPFMVLPLYSVMSKIDGSLQLAAQSLGAKPSVAFWRIYVPLTKPGIFAGTMTVFVLSLGFYIIPALLGSPRNTMISAMIQQQVSGLLEWGRGSAMGIVLLVSTLIVIAIFMRLSRGLKLDGVGRL